MSSLSESSQTGIGSRPGTADGSTPGTASTVPASSTTGPPSHTSSQTVQLSFDEVLAKELLDIKKKYEMIDTKLQRLQTKQEQWYKALSLLEKAKKALSRVTTREEKEIQDLQRRRDKLVEEYNATELTKLTLKAKELSESTARHLRAMEDEARKRFV